MKNIFQETIEQVDLGARFKVDFQNRSLKVDGKFIIENGQYEGELGVEPADLPVILSEIENLYFVYKHSIPSERSDAKHRVYFKALPEHELEDEDMLYGERRESAQAKLELYILCCILNGSFVWDDNTLGKWFWHSQADKDLIILKSWVNQ